MIATKSGSATVRARAYHQAVISHRLSPGIPVIASMANGYTDATFLGAVGIPTYGIPGIWYDPDGNGAHGLNERMEVRSIYVGRDYMFELVKAYAD